jgi:hypothetical protein
MFLATSRAAWTSGANPSNYRVVAQSGFEVVDQGTAPFLDGKSITVDQELFATNESAERIPLLTTPATIGTGNFLQYDGWINIPSGAFSLSDGVDTRLGYMYARGTQTWTDTGEAGNVPDQIAVFAKVASTNQKFTSVFNPDSGGFDDEGTVGFGVQVKNTFQNVGFAIPDVVLDSTDSGVWAGWINVKVQYWTNSTDKDGQNLAPNSFGSWRNGTNTVGYRITIRPLNSTTTKIAEVGFGGATGSYTLDVDTSTAQELVGGMNFDWDDETTNLGNMVLGPMSVGTTYTNRLVDEISDGVGAVYTGAVDSAIHHLPWVGATDALRLENKGSAGDFDDDATGSLSATGTMQ